MAADLTTRQTDETAILCMAYRKSEVQPTEWPQCLHHRGLRERLVQ